MKIFRMLVFFLCCSHASTVLAAPNNIDDDWCEVNKPPSQTTEPIVVEVIEGQQFEFAHIPNSSIAMQTTHVTNDQWNSIMGEADDEENKDLPKVDVSYEMIQEFIGALNERLEHSNYTFRLPTQWEWGMAARSGSVDFFPWGDDLSDAPLYISESKTVQPVGRKQANTYGLFDLPGNIQEFAVVQEPHIISWVLGAQIAVHGLSFEEGFYERVVSCERLNCQRFYETPDFSSQSVGFRLVIDRSPKKNAGIFSTWLTSE